MTTIPPPDLAVFGLEVESSLEVRRGVLGSLDTSPAGNVIIRAGRELDGADRGLGWTKTEHVVLVPTEARRFAARVLELAGAPDRPGPDDYEPLPDEDRGKACTLCACEAVVVLFGFRTCGYHATNSEDAPPCVVCSTRTRDEDLLETLDRESGEGQTALGAHVERSRRIEAARELLVASRAATGQKVDVERWLAAKRTFVEVVGYRPGDRVALDDLGVTRVVTVKAIEDDEAVFDLDPLHRDVRRPVAELLPIVAELLVAAGEVLDELEEVGS